MDYQPSIEQTYDERVIETPNLTVPHPRLGERAFVLVPLAEIAPEARHPTLKKTMRELMAAAGDDGVALVAPAGWHRA